MSKITDWVRNYSMVVLLMTLFTSLTAKKEYRKYIQLFVEIILVLTFINPLLDAAGVSKDLFDKIAYDSFWQELDGIKKDQDKMDFLKEDYYISYYEDAIEADVILLAENSGYVITGAKVKLNNEYQVEKMDLEVAKERVDTVIIGSVKEQPEKMAITALKEKIAKYYQIDTDKISIRD